MTNRLSEPGTLGGILGGLPPTKEAWVTYAYAIDQNTLRGFFQGVTAAMGDRYTRIHVLFQTNGGNIADGVALYNFLRTAPIDIALYNVGSVCSVGVVAYLGAKTRVANQHSTFMIHRSWASPTRVSSEAMAGIARGLGLDDERTEAILREAVELSDEQWATHKSADLWLSAKDAVQSGIATELGDFAPPLGAQVFNI